MVISAVCSGIGGMLGVAHFGSAQQNEFDTYLLDSIAAVVVGGTSLFGGRGGIGNTIVGLFVLGVLNNGLDHVNIDSFLKIPDPRPDPAGGAGDQRLCAAAEGEGGGIVPSSSERSLDPSSEVASLAVNARKGEPSKDERHPVREPGRRPS